MTCTSTELDSTREREDLEQGLCVYCLYVCIPSTHEQQTALSRSDCVFRCHVCSPVSLCSLPAGAGCGLRVPRRGPGPPTRIYPNLFTVVSFTRARADSTHQVMKKNQVGVATLWTATRNIGGDSTL